MLVERWCLLLCSLKRWCLLLYSNASLPRLVSSLPLLKRFFSSALLKRFFSSALLCSNASLPIDFPEYDEDKISFFELVSTWSEFGYSKNSQMYGLLPCGNFNEDKLLHLTNDVDVFYLLSKHKVQGSMDIIIYVLTNQDDVEHDNDYDDDEEEVEEEKSQNDKEFDEYDVFLNKDVERPEEDDIFSKLGEKYQDDTIAYKQVENCNVEILGSIQNDEELDLSEWNEPSLDRDVLGSPQNSCDEEQGHKWPQFIEDKHMANPILEKGLEFGSASLFRKALREYCVRESIDYKWIKNEGHRMSAHCRNACGWRIYASLNKQSGSIQIKTLHPKCKCGMTFQNLHVNSSYLATKFNEEFEDNPEWKVQNIKKSIRKKICVDISTSQAYRAKRKAIEMREGTDEAQYLKLWDYAQMIKTTNPGSCVKIQCEKLEESGQTRFQRMYVRFQAQKVGFLAGCRPIVGLDACFLKGQFGGQLMAAVGLDGNNNQFPIAMAVVEQENRDAWEWFLDIFSEDIGRPDELGLVFMSDRQKGLLDVFNEKWPTVEHRYCMKHMYANFKQKYKEKALRDAMWLCAFATTPRKFQEKMEELKKISKEAYDDLIEVNPSHWSISHFSARAKCDMLTNNNSESFNSYIKDARDKPIISLFECLRLKLMKSFHVKLTGMQKFGGPFCPNALEKLEKIKNDSKNCFALPSSTFLYEVACFDGNHVVDLNIKECSCRLWNITGIPCKHAVAAIQMNREQPEKYIHDCYSKETYIRTYSEIIKPMPGEVEWMETNLPPILPPRIIRPPVPIYQPSIQWHHPPWFYPYLGNVMYPMTYPVPLTYNINPVPQTFSIPDITGVSDATSINMLTTPPSTAKENRKRRMEVISERRFRHLSKKSNVIIAMRSLPKIQDYWERLPIRTNILLSQEPRPVSSRVELQDHCKVMTLTYPNMTIT
ncbi:Glycoside hydrolase, family 47 [Senna tora]|uniref:Glycoside hydrolase, family 47 n=1 Tax=Senna tora TaxID=362788 RepID=A0A835CBP6_9FABA|nr:Glycoside hydrolase, family 47 [Senna tora]